MKKALFILSTTLLFSTQITRAHCPLCTVGAAAAAGGAAYLGVDKIVIGLLIGAFAVSLGLWIGRVLKKKYIPFQTQALMIFSFATTVIPLMPLLSDTRPLFVFITGSYGSLLNRTYLIDYFLLGSLIGGFIMFVSPWLSKRISIARNGRALPYQGVALTLGLLLIIGVTLQFLI